MNKILSKNVNCFLYNHQIPRDFSYLIRSFLITELGMEMNAGQEQQKELEEKLKDFGKTYPINEVLTSLVEYIKFIILNNSRGNYNINRGFEFEEDIINHKDYYCLYLKYIFDTMGISLDYFDVNRKLGKRKLNKGDVRFGNLIYEFLQEIIFKEIGKMKENGLIELGENTIVLTKYPKNICQYMGIEKNGIDAYSDISDEYKNLYSFLKELKDLHAIQHVRNDETKRNEYDQKLNLYYDLWFTTKYARAQNRNAPYDEIEEIKREYENFYRSRGKNYIQPLEEKKEQFLQKSYEIEDNEI